MSEREQAYLWRIGLRAAPASLWPLISDTDRFNRACGYPPVERLPPGPGTPPGVQLLRARVLGLTIDWEENPFEWVEPSRFSVDRRYSSGPVARLLMRCALHAQPDGGTLVEYELRLTPSGLAGRLTMPFAIGRRVRAVTTQVLQDFDREILERASPGVPGPAAGTRRSGPRPPPRGRLAPGGAPRLEAIVRQLASDQAQPQAMVDRLADHIRGCEDSEAARMRPYALAGDWGRSRAETLDLFLHATRAGLLDFTWRVLCPHCRGSALEEPSLSRIGSEARCPNCAVDFTAEFDRSVELTFKPNPAIRTVPRIDYCIGGPQVTPHIVAQVRLPREAAVDLPVAFSPGGYRVRRGPDDPPVAFRVEPAAPGRLELVLGPRASPGPDGPPRDAGHPSVCPGGVLGLRLPAGAAAGPAGIAVVERVAWTDLATTAADVASRQLFRDLFSRELLRPGERISVGSVTIVFTDLKDSTRLYRELGDAPAFGRVLSHFDILRGAVAAEGGAVVKSMGDAVLAVFPRPSPAIRALLAARQRLAEGDAEGRHLVLKASVHTGPCLAINQNERLDYFGTTVNVGARLCSLCTGAGLVLSDAVRMDEEVDALIGPPGTRFRLESEDAFLKGLPGERIRLWRLMPLL